MSGRKTNGIQNVDALKNNEDEIIEEVKVEEPAETTELPEITTDEVPEQPTNETEANETEATDKVVGVVAECESLNIRSLPNTECEVVSVLRVGSEVIVYEEDSTDDFYKVCTSAGLDGYCMKQYITVK